MRDFKTESSLPALSGRPPAKGAAVSPVPVRGGRSQTARSSRAATANNNITPLPTRNKVAIAHSSRKHQAGVGNRISPVPMQDKARVVARGEHILGRIKAPPVCAAPSLKREASSAEDLTGACFSQREAAICAESALVLLRGGEVDVPAGEMSLTGGRASGCTKTMGMASSMSSSATVVTMSSTSSCERGTLAGSEMAEETVSTHGPPLDVVRTGSAVGPEDVPVARDGENVRPESSSAAFANASFADGLVAANSSRQGRSLQRWLVRPATGELVRRAAGTIPLTRDGRVVLISAGRKEEWILPKGGWDADETMEECAIRETFEEAGLLGRLGGEIGPLDYAAGKARKRGGAMGDDRRPCKRARTGRAAAPRGLSPAERLTEVPRASARWINPRGHSYVRLHLFPLYVTDARSDWPEGGRLRRMVDIDEAIAIMTRQDRPYFRRGLEIVKERGLHLPRP